MNEPRPFLHAFGSLWFGAVLLVLLLFAMASATVFESTHGTEQALALFYHSWWFFGLLGIFAASSVAALIARYPYGKRDLGFLFTHGALILILAGSLVTQYVGERGRVVITEGETATEWQVEGSELLVLQGPRGQVFQDIASSIGGHFEPTDLHSAPTLKLESVSVEPIRYFPDSHFHRTVPDDATSPSARIGWSLKPVTPPRQRRMPGVVLRVRNGDRIEEIGLQKYQRPRPIEGTDLEISWRYEVRPLGFGIKLDRFHLGRYPGTGRPRSFESHVTVTEPATGRTQSTVISMNNPGKFGDYTLYQSSYQMGQGPTYTVLSVSDDPGQIIVFLGYFVLMGGMIIVLAIRMADRRRIDRARRMAEVALEAERGEPRNQRRSAPMAVLLLLGMLASAGVACGQGSPRVPANLDMETLRALPCQHDGRWPPLDTVARDVVLEVTGDTFFQDRDPVAVLLAWTFEPVKWQTAPLIPIRNAELRGEIGLPADRTVFSLSELIDHPTLRPMMDAAVEIQGRKPDPLESKVLDIREKLIQLQRIFGNQVIRPIPHPSDMLGSWLPAPMPGQEVSPALEPFRQAWSALRAAFLSGDSAAFSAGSNELLAAARALPAAHRPASKLIAAELRYNESNPLRGAWILMAIAAALAGLGMVIRRRGFDALVVLILVAAFAWLSYGLSLRWQFAGRIPASNMFESLLFLGWGVSAFAIIAWFVLKHRLVLLTAAAMGALSLCLADVLPIDKFVRPIAPVLLDTVWMSIHVPIIMVSYAVLAIAVLIAHVQIVGMAIDPRDRDLTDSVDSFHYWFVHVGSILLTIGIITGSMWAASSWGRYWGWDPKEVWSLAALFGYMAVIHVRADKMTAIPPWLKWLAALVGTATLAVILPYLAPFSAMKLLALAGAVAGIVAMVALRGPFATALKSILCFWLIIMTYVGVNYVLGTGLHSYGFGTGAMVRYLYLIGGIDLALLGSCAVLYYARRPRALVPQRAPESSTAAEGA